MVPLKKPKVTVKTYPWWNWASYMFWARSKKWKIGNSNIRVYIYTYTHLSNGNFYIPLNGNFYGTMMIHYEIQVWFPLEFQKNPSINPANDDFGFQNQIPSELMSLQGHSQGQIPSTPLISFIPTIPSVYNTLNYWVDMPVCPIFPVYSVLYKIYTIIYVYIYIIPIHVYSYDIHTLSALSWLCFIPHICRWIPN